MPNDKTTNYEFDLINDSDSVKAGVKTKPNANWNALDELLHDDFATQASQEAQDALIERAWKDGEAMNLYQVTAQALEEAAAGIDGLSFTDLGDGWVQIDNSNDTQKAFYLSPPANLQIPTDVNCYVVSDGEMLSGTALAVYTYAKSNSQFFKARDTAARPNSGFHSFRLTKRWDGTNPTFYTCLTSLKITSKASSSYKLKLSLVLASAEPTAYVPYDGNAPVVMKQRVADLEASQETQDARLDALESSQATQDTQLALAWKDPSTVNLEPFFNEFATQYPVIALNHWDFEQLNGGWAHLDFKLNLSYSAMTFRVIRGYGLVDGRDYTMLVEIANMTSDDAISNVAILPGSGEQNGLRGSEIITVNVSDMVDGKAYFNVTYHAGWTISLVTLRFESLKKDQGIDIRISLYEGNYTGDYVPYDKDAPLIAKHRIAALEAKNITQDAILSLVNVVSFDANSGTGTQSPVAALSGQSTTIPQCSYTYDGHTFIAWNTASDGTGITYNPGDTITPTGAMTLYAQWSAVS